MAPLPSSEVPFRIPLFSTQACTDRPDLPDCRAWANPLELRVILGQEGAGFTVRFSLRFKPPSFYIEPFLKVLKAAERVQLVPAPSPPPYSLQVM